ncbi:MAG: cobalamin-binding protein, partial [Candidatus Rokubacteria bacterium]|nr:cobalamin-binding protein [Candidatus Rokubacteria bacterium]
MTRLGIAVVCLLLLAGPAGAFTVRDMLGREVTLAAPPQRIISLVPSVTEVIYALGGEERLVGVTDYCDWPPAARQKPRVGSMLAPNLETIVALRPDLVVATSEGNRQETFIQLRRLNIPVFTVNPHRLSDVLAVFTQLGALTGRQAHVGPLTEAVTRRIKAVTNAVKPYPRPKVLYVLWPEPLIVPGREGLVTELIELAGGTSITALAADAYPRFSLEAVVARAPEVIILARHGGDGTPLLRAPWERLTTLPAVRARRVHSVDGTYLHRYGPRVVDGLEMLARVIHP